MTDVTAQAFREAAAQFLSPRFVWALAPAELAAVQKAHTLLLVAAKQREIADQSATMLHKTMWTLDNIYTIARREHGKHDPHGRWGHIIRLCEAVGCQPRGVLKDNGGSMEGPPHD